MLARFIIRSRGLSTSSIRLGTDAREKRLGHVKKSDKVEGEQGTFTTSTTPSYELVDENLMDKVINNVKFKDIPIITIKCSRNNTKMWLSHGDGTVIEHKSCGSEGFKNCRKGTTVAAQAVANRILTAAIDNEINMARMVFHGLGPDRTQAAEPWNRRPRATKSI